MDEQHGALLVGHAGRLTAMRRASGVDTFTRVRVWSASILLIAGVLAIIGSAIDWVTVEPPPGEPAGIDFEGRPFATEESSDPFTGLEASDGWVTVIGGALMLMAGIRLVTAARGGGAGALGAIVTGAIAISAYRAVGSPTSGIMERTDTVGDAEPGAGLILLVLATVVGLIAAIFAMAATPPTGRGAEP